MNYRRLGRTNLQVSEISLGTVELGMDYGIPARGDHLQPSEADAARTLNCALDLGVNLIDTARAYGESEAIIGRVLKSRRTEYLLATKISSSNWESYTGKELREQVEASITESLRTLQTDTIDLLYIHNATPELIQCGEIAEIMQRAQQAGYARFIGTTTYGEAAPLAVLEDGRFDCVQVAYNLLDRQLEERVLPLAKANDIGVVIRSVLLKGALTYRYTHLPDELRELRAVVDKVNSLCGAQANSLPELAYRFVLAQPAVSTALVGTGRVYELEEIVSFSGCNPLPTEILNTMRETVVSPDQLNPGNWPFR
ncbi:aldo/keto reductase [Candidatus Poribacteria bacterium]|nr:aldo/keto reductase [Candidatus Poribacteria bacterium]